MTALWLSNWYNLIFIVPFGLALLYLALYTLSGWTFGDADADADAHLDADGHLDTDGHLEADAHAEAEGHFDADLHSELPHGHNGSAALALLSWFGLGRTPLSILLMILLMSWGLVGFAANSYARTTLPQLQQPWLLSVPLAALGSLLITKLLASLVGRYAPISETYARRRHELLGQEGDVVLPVDAHFGMVAVRDPRSGELFQLPCRLEAGDRVIDKNAKVKLVAYNANEKLFYVIDEFRGEGVPPSRNPQADVGEAPTPKA